MLLQAALVTVYIVGVSTTYEPCVGPSLQFDGYTYIIDPDTGQNVWSHCAFFNPLTDHALCERPVGDGQKGYICDPDNLLKSNTSMDSLLDQKLREVQSKTGTVCFDNAGNRIRIIVAVAVIDRIRIPDLKNPDTCINDCGQLLPWNQNKSWYPSDEEQYEILLNFADGLRHVWKIGQCNNEVIVLYCKEFNKIQFSAGVGASGYLTWKQIYRIRQRFLSYLQSTDFDQGLEQAILFLLVELQESLKSIKVAVLLISTVLSLVAGALVWFLVYAARTYYEITILRHKYFSYPWKAMSWLLKIGSGIWLIEQSLLFMVLVSQKMNRSCLLMSVSVILASFVFYAVILKVVVTDRDQPYIANG